MLELKIHLPDELDRRFRKTAMAVHGYGRGSISKAAIEALAKWCTDHEPAALAQAESNTKEERPISEAPKDDNKPEPSESTISKTLPQDETDPSTSGTSLPTT